MMGELLGIKRIPEIENLIEGIKPLKTSRCEDPSRLTPGEIISRVRRAGVLGMGGGEFPTHIKLDPRCRIEWVLINGCESEPYVTCDTAVFRRYRDEVECGLRLIMQAVGANKGKVIKKGLRYVSGYEKKLVEDLTGIVIPPHKRPQDFGFLVFNIQTARAIHHAVCCSHPSSSRVLTFLCSCQKRPRNFEVLLGTPFVEIKKSAGCTCPGELRWIKDGLMMGELTSLSQQVSAGTTSLFLVAESQLEKKAEGVCINCGFCSDDCPVDLAPKFVCENSSSQDWDLCIECGFCEFICPADIHLLQRIRLKKSDGNRLNGGL